jgi:3-hydroxyacyl-[acyl-carrier-protein] dehydratase
MRHFHLDRIESLEPGVRAVGLRAVALSDDVFTEHFPGNPVLPGVYVLEGLAQTAGQLLWESAARSRIAVLVSVDRARFTSFARPGEVVRLSVEIDSQDERAARVRGVATVGERQVAAAALTFSMQELNRMIPPIYQPYWERAAEVLAGRFPGSSDA